MSLDTQQKEKLFTKYGSEKEDYWICLQSSGFYSQKELNILQNI